MKSATIKTSIVFIILISGISILKAQPPMEQKAIEQNALNKIPKNFSEIMYENVNMFPEKAQLSIALIKNGEVNYYGIIKENDSIKTIQNENKVFEIGSITKVFSATVLADLVVKNKLQMNYPAASRRGIRRVPTAELCAKSY
uniref:serine hydrolase n=1 Tax=uncultured Draconibacterium sp. TaxID=1573823 RepID=UPI00321770B9